MTVLKGKSVYQGITLGPVRIKRDIQHFLPDPSVRSSSFEEDLTQLHRAQEQVTQDLQGMYEALERTSQEEAEIFQGHIEFVQDPEIQERVLALMKEQSFPVVTALYRVFEEAAKEIETLEDAYLRERAQDLRDVRDRLILASLGKSTFSTGDQRCIYIAQDMSPSEVVQYKGQLLGYAIAKGGMNAHSSILAKSAGLISLIQVEGIGEAVEEGDFAILDTYEGKILINPDAQNLQKYRKRMLEEEKKLVYLASLRDKEAVTRDGRSVEQLINVGSLEEMQGLVKVNAQGVGLYRTEFLFMQQTQVPSEDFQKKHYQQAIAVNQRPHFVIRTLDIGGDKSLPYWPLPVEANPFLGKRGLRLSEYSAILTTQFRAILRASVAGSVQVMIPMVIGVEEMQEVRFLWEQVRQALQEEGEPFDASVPLGIMLETPASIWIVDLLAEVADFFSIGTNDLTQYVLAVDRDNEAVASLYDSFHPAVLRAIAMAIEKAQAANRPLSMCGEFAGEPLATQILLGLGLEKFSMTALQVPRIKDIIRQSQWSDCQKLAQQALACSCAQQVRELAQQGLKSIGYFGE